MTSPESFRIAHSDQFFVEGKILLCQHIFVEHPLFWHFCNMCYENGLFIAYNLFDKTFKQQ